MTDPTLPPPAGPAPVPRRRGRWVLIASLALNLILIGALVGGAARAWRNPPQAGAQPGSALVLLWRALPEDDRRALRGPLEGPRPGTGAERGGDPAGEGRAERSSGRRADWRAEWRAGLVAEVAVLRALLTAEPFDRGALAAHLTAARDRQAARAETALERMLDRVAGMTPAERAAMVDRLERRSLRRSERPGRD